MLLGGGAEWCRRRARRGSLGKAIALVACGLAWAGCGARFGARHRPSGWAERVWAQGVEVGLIEDGEDDATMIRLRVDNHAMRAIVINRDAIYLRAAGRVLRREPGGLRAAYTVHPGERQDVHLVFDASALVRAGDDVEVLLDEAFRFYEGEAIPLSPLPLVVR